MPTSRCYTFVQLVERARVRREVHGTLDAGGVYFLVGANVFKYNRPKSHDVSVVLRPINSHDAPFT
jgi:hypothetical protein